MANVDLRRACVNSLSQVAGDIENAVVYVDAGSGEALHFIGGLSALLPFKPRAVCSLESASDLDSVLRCNGDIKQIEHKVLIITSTLLSDAHRYILRCLRSHAVLKHCIILSSISEEAHLAHPDTPLGPDAFHDYKKLLLEHFQVPASHKEALEPVTKLEGKSNTWTYEETAMLGHSPTKQKHGEFELGNSANESAQSLGVETEGLMDVNQSGLVIEVKHFPMIICPLTSKSFVFPSGGALAGAPLSHKLEKGIGLGLPRVDTGALLDDEESIPEGGILLAHFLQQLAGQLDLKLDVYTMGPLSHDVGKLLTELSGIADVSGRSKKPTGVLLMDRTLDLVTPSCHGDSLMDRFFSLLPRRTNESNAQKTTSRSICSVVKRHPLDVRLPTDTVTNGDIAVHPLGSLNEDCCAFLSTPEAVGSLQGSTSQKPDFAKEQDETNSKFPNETLLLLSAMGGSLFDSQKAHETGQLDLLFEKRIKEAAVLIKKWLLEALRQEKMSVPGRSRLRSVTAEDLCVLRKHLMKNFGCMVRHADIIQMAKATELALGPELGPKWEAFSGAEKVLSLSVGDSSQTVAFQIKDLVHQSSQIDSTRPTFDRLHGHSLLSLRDALTLAIVGYILAGDCFGNSGTGGPFTWEEERDLKQAVVDAVSQGRFTPRLGFLDGLQDSILEHWQEKLCGESSAKAFVDVNEEGDKAVEDGEVNFDEGWGAWGDDDVVESKGGEEGYGEMQLQLEVRDRVEEVFKRLHKVSETRKNLLIKDKPLPMEETGYSGMSRPQRSLIYKILSLVFSKADIPGLEHHSSVIGRFFKSGLGRFGLGQAKPKLSDNKVILVFVIGGINGMEVCEAKEAQAAHVGANGYDVLLGGTSYLTPDDVYDLVIGSLNST